MTVKTGRLRFTTERIIDADRPTREAVHTHLLCRDRSARPRRLMRGLRTDTRDLPVTTPAEPVVARPTTARYSARAVQLGMKGEHR